MTQQQLRDIALTRKQAFHIAGLPANVDEHLSKAREYKPTMEKLTAEKEALAASIEMVQPRKAVS